MAAPRRPHDVPAALWRAIVKAAKKYGVNPYVLAGIWRVESGSSYPDNAVNSQGYGGLFGTTNYNGSTQSQANTAASILSRLLHQYGSYSAALKHYSGGGYSSVPGVTTQAASGVTSGGGIFPKPYNPRDSKVGRVDQGVDITSAGAFTAVAPGRVVHIDPNFYNGTPAVYIKLDKPVTVDGTTYKGVYYAETPVKVHVGQHVQTGQPISGPGNAEIGFAAQFGKSSASWLPAAHGHYVEGYPTAEGGDFNVAIGNKGGDASTGGPVVTAIGQAAHDFASPFEAIAAFLGKLSSAAFWLRALEVVGGGILVLLGLYLLAKQVGLAPGPLDVTPGGKLAEEAAKTFQEPAGVDTYQPQYRRSSEGVKRDTVRHDVSERGARRRAVKARAARAQPSEETPF